MNENKGNSGQYAEELTQHAHAAVDRAGAKASEIERGLKERASQAAESAAEIEENLREGARQRQAQARRYIRSNPFAAAGFAFAAGFVLSALFRR